MQLNILICTGERKKETIHISEIDSYCEPTYWLKENEAVEIRLTTPKNFCDATLELYDHAINPTYREDNSSTVTFVWKPKNRWNGSLESLFFNYFGVAELSVALTDTNNVDSIVSFQPIDIIASKANSSNVESMFRYLSELDDDVLHSIFETTKHSAGFNEGTCSPNGNLERLEFTLNKLLYLFQDVISKPITKLMPMTEVIQATGEEELDDSSLAWLMSNLSELEETDDDVRAHLEYESSYYKANSIQVPVLKESTDIYENQVLHGFIVLLISETKKQLEIYSNGLLKDKVLTRNLPIGYTSFFDQVKKFQHELIHKQKCRCASVLDSFTKMKQYLESKLPVSQALLGRPMLTPKSVSCLPYRIIFIEFIDWFEKKTPDWSAYKNLLAIKSIPTLFETFCYYRTCKVLNRILNNESNLHDAFFIDHKMVEITLVREPKYWMPNSNKAIESYFINSEGQTVYGGQVNERAHKGAYAHRCPDIVIEVKVENTPAKLIVLDAKYQEGRTAFSQSLKDCTMKYVHGIHYADHGGAAVHSMTILHPCDDGVFTSFHSDEYSLFGSKPASPALQCVGMRLGEAINEDQLERVIYQLLISSGVTTCKYSDGKILLEKVV